MKYLPTIPEGLTADQANALINLLHRLADAIWDQYDDAITFQQDLDRLEHYHQQLNPLNQWDDDDIPF